MGVTALGQTLVFILLPSLGRAAGLAEIQVGLIISCSSLAFALASPIWGYLSELRGRRPVLHRRVWGSDAVVRTSVAISQAAS